MLLKHTHTHTRCKTECHRNTNYILLEFNIFPYKVQHTELHHSRDQGKCESIVVGTLTLTRECDLTEASKYCAKAPIQYFHFSISRVLSTKIYKHQVIK